MLEKKKAFMELIEQNAASLTETELSFLAGYAIGAESARTESDVGKETE